MKKIHLPVVLASMLLVACGSNPQPSSVTPSSETSSEPAGSSQASSSQSQATSSEEPSSSHEPRHNDEPIDYESLKVNLPEKKLVDDFAFGADLSMVAEVERNGGVYYNEEGVEEDVFQILARDGVNYARFRLWNDPKNSEGLPYGGGNNDLATDIALAKRAKAAGMKVLLDFHYSDFWADPAKQHLPKAWGDAMAFDIGDYVAEFTSESLAAFKAAGVTVDSCQIGNETNNGIAGFSTSEPATVESIVSSGVAAAKSVFPEIKTLVHLTNIKSPRGVYKFLDAVKNVDYDIVGLSYYPFWHGSKENLLNVMNKIRDDYNRPTMVVETSYGFTDEIKEGYCANTYNSSTFETPGGYLTSVQGQATEVSDIISTISKVKDNYGQGIFYWEPAWLPIKGAGWATAVGQYYDDNNGADGTAAQATAAGYKDGLSSWSNQGWFSYTGKALASASTYAHIQKGDRTVKEEIKGLRTEEIDVNVNLISGKVTLPSTAQVITNLDALRSLSVAWDQDQIAEILEKGDGEYVVTGRVDGKFEIKCNVTAETNYVKDYSFEEQADGEEVPVGEPWVIESQLPKATRIEAKSEGNLDGEKYFHWYNASDFSFTLSQKLTGVRKGVYDLSTHIMAGDLPTDYTKYDLWYQIEGKAKVSLDIIPIVVKGWGAPLARYMNKAMIPSIEITEDNTSITIGISAEVGGSGWGHCDLWSFAIHKDVPVETNYIADGDLGLQVSGSPLKDPWVVDANASSAMSVGSEPMDSEAVNNVKWWAGSDFTFAFHQDIEELKAGTYDFTMVILSCDKGGYNSFDLYYKIGNGEEVVVDLLPYCLGWHDSDAASTVKVALDPIEVSTASSFTLGFRCDAKNGAWGRMTDFSLKDA